MYSNSNIGWFRSLAREFLPLWVLLVSALLIFWLCS
jgi:hypothetical protein